MRYAIEHDCVYLSALKASTPKSFTVELLRKLRERYEPTRTEPIIGPKARLFKDILDTINGNTTKDHMPLIIIDEVDNIMHYPHEEIIGMLRDIADNTVAGVVLVGMQDLREKVMKLNSHYYNRFIYFAEFKPLTDNDVLMMCTELATIAISPDLARFTNEKPQAGGDARKVIKAIRLYEEIAHKLSITSLDLNTYLKVVGK
jgi:Cdc6-like AAA superfamily ATPase